MSRVQPALLDSPSRMAGALLVLVAGTAALYFLFWPAGVVFGLVAGSGAVLVVGRRLEAEWSQDQTAWLPAAPAAVPTAAVAEPVEAEAQDDAGRPEAAPAPAAASITVAVAEPMAVPAPVVVSTTAASEAEPLSIVQAVSLDEDPPVERENEAEQTAIRPELQALKKRLGDETADFTRAAALVITTQYASAARLQRELHVPYARARRLLDDLESLKIVGPPTGSSPRRVLLAKDDLADVDLDRLVAGA